MWRETGHPCSGCTHICSSDRAQPLGWSSQSRGSFSTESIVDDSLIQKRDIYPSGPWRPQTQSGSKNQLCKGTAENRTWLPCAWTFRWYLASLWLNWRWALVGRRYHAEKCYWGVPGLSLPDWLPGCCWMCAISHQADSAPTVAAPQQQSKVKMRQLAFNYSPKKKKHHWF